MSWTSYTFHKTKLPTHTHTHKDRGSSSRQVDGAKCQAFLLFDEKQSFRRLGEIIYHKSKSGDIYVRRDALAVLFDTGQLLYGNIITYRGNGLGELWKLVFADGSNLLGKGLVAFGLQNLAIIWVKGKPRGLGNIVGKSPGVTPAMYL